MFCVGINRIVTHNFEVCSATAFTAVLSLLCPPAVPVAAIGQSIAFGIAGIGIYFLHKKYQKNKDNERYPVYNSDIACACGGKPPKHEKDEEEHPHEIYEGSGYHHMNSGGSKSAAPKDGQSCLDHSIPIHGTSTQRIGIEGDKFVIFKKTAYGTYHGYVVTWKEIVSGGNSYS
jgi:hypothetical protein